jgi:hypothetical protein
MNNNKNKENLVKTYVLTLGILGLFSFDLQASGLLTEGDSPVPTNSEALRAAMYNKNPLNFQTPSRQTGKRAVTPGTPEKPSTPGTPAKPSINSQTIATRLDFEE